MSESTPVELTKEDFDRIEWQDVPAQDQLLIDYANLYYERATAASARGDSRAEVAYRLLADLCSFKMELDTPENPFRPWALTETTHSALPDSVTPHGVQVFRELAATINDSALRARVADFVWVRGRGYPIAQLAVSSYLELAEPLRHSDKDWSKYVRYLERGLQIALQLSRNSAPYETASTFILDIIRRRAATERGFLSKALLSLAARHRLGDSPEMYDIAAAIATRGEVEGNWHQAERYWEIAKELARGDQEKRKEANLRLAESYVGRARDAADQPHIGPITAATRLRHALEVLRRDGGASERVDQLHAEMMEYQRKIPDTLVPITSSIDISDAVKASRDAVTDKSLPEALVVLALLAPLPAYSKLRAQAEEDADRFMFKSFFPSVQLNREGKVIDRQGSTNASDPNQREASLRKDMFQNATFLYQALAKGTVEPARRRILEDHPVRVDDFYWIVSDNPLVPPGREMLFAEALYAGFVGDMTKAIPLLVHQLEHSIRELLGRTGVIVTAINKEGIQSERNLNSLLYEPKLKQLLGEDLVFSLQGLLVEKFGSNLRNEVAHGLLPYDGYFSYVCLYLWWLSFRLVSLPVLKTLEQQAQGVAEQELVDPAQSESSPT